MIDADTIEELWASVFHRLERLETRFEGSERMGLVTEVDAEKGLARVDLGADPKTGEPMISPWIPWEEVAMGPIKTHFPPGVGEQVTVTSANGEMTDARIRTSVPSNANERPHDKEKEGVITVGNFRMHFKDGLLSLKVGDSEIQMTGDKIMLKSATVEADASTVFHVKGPKAFLETEKTYHFAEVDIRVETEAGPTSHVFAQP